MYVSQGLVKRFDFTAVSPDGKEYVIRQRAEYMPGTGLSHLPFIDTLNPGQTPRLEFTTKDLIYVPVRAPIVEFGTLLSRGYSVRAAFGVTDKDLQEALNQDLAEILGVGDSFLPRSALLNVSGNDGKPYCRSSAST